MAPLDPVSQTSARSAPPPDDAVQFHRAAQDFEAIFIQTLLRTMRESIGQKGVFPRGNALKIYESVQDQELARAMARGGGMGLADLLVRDVTRRMGADKKASSPRPGESITLTQPTPPAAGRDAVTSEEGLK